MPLENTSLILIYIAVVSFLIYTFKNKKPLKWSEVLNAIPFHQYLKTSLYQNDIDDVFRICKWNQNLYKSNPQLTFFR
jgi:hypothetical protein